MEALATVIDEREIWRAATLLVDHFGDAGPDRAAEQADKMLAEGDIDGQLLWKRILYAVEELLKGREDGPLH